jgi:hypothetical protein
MANSSKGAKGPRLGTQFRGKLASVYGQRGVALSSLWYVFSPRTQRDWVLKSDLEWDHFVLAEADPLIVTANYAPDAMSLEVEGEVQSVPVDAVLNYTDGRTEWREIRYANKSPDANTTDRRTGLRCDAAARMGVKYVLWTETEIRPNVTLLANWRRVLAWMSAARERSLAPYQEELATMIKARRSISLGSLELAVGEQGFPMYAAALFSDLQHGKYASDLAVVPLSPKTVIRALDGGAGS